MEHPAYITKVGDGRGPVIAARAGLGRACFSTAPTGWRWLALVLVICGSCRRPRQALRPPGRPELVRRRLSAEFAQQRDLLRSNYCIAGACTPFDGQSFVAIPPWRCRRQPVLPRE